MTPIEGNEDFVKQAIRNQMCAEHNDRVIAVYDGKANIWRAKCGHGEYPSLLKAVETGKQVQARSADAAVPIGFGNLPTTDLGDYHKLTVSEVQALRAFADKYGLDADRGHIYAMYGQAYIGLDGYIYHARSERIVIHMGSRPMTPTEYKLYKIASDDYAWIAEGWAVTPDNTQMGLGIVTAEEVSAMSAKHPDQKRSPVVAGHPQIMAQKRAEWQWYRRATPIGEYTAGGQGGASASVTVKVEPTTEEAAAHSAETQKEVKELFGDER